MKVINLSNRLAILYIAQPCLYAQPPKAPSQPVTETYFGKQITEPYRNLGNLSDSTGMNWYKTQAVFTEEQFNKLPIRDTIRNELRKLDSKFKFTVKLMPGVVPTYRGHYIFVPVPNMIPSI